jgi:hypothetical protein
VQVAMAVLAAMSSPQPIGDRPAHASATRKSAGSVRGLPGWNEGSPR